MRGSIHEYAEDWKCCSKMYTIATFMQYTGNHKPHPAGLEQCSISDMCNWIKSRQCQDKFVSNSGFMKQIDIKNYNF